MQFRWIFLFCLGCMFNMGVSTIERVAEVGVMGQGILVDPARTFWMAVIVVVVDPPRRLLKRLSFMHLSY